MSLEKRVLHGGSTTFAKVLCGETWQIDLLTDQFTPRQTYLISRTAEIVVEPPV
jgi:hypothetical protein